MTQYFGKPPLEYTTEIQRIEAIPRRTWSDADLATLAARMTALLKTPKGTMTLRPLQALALHDLYTTGGLIGMIQVGGGKTLISGLAPYMLEAKRPLLVLPAALIDKTKREFDQLREHWRIPTGIRMESYESFGVVSGANVLTDWKPDFVFFDEGQKVKNRKAGRTRRFVRYFRDYPCRAAVVTGTFMKHSLRDYAHLFRWALRDPPVPFLEGEVSQWADAIDVDVNPLVRRPPGALLRFCAPEDRVFGDDLASARKGLQRRFIQTPGVVASHELDQTDCSLYVSALPYTMAPILEQYYTDLRNLMTTPDGWTLVSGIEVWSHARQLALGMHGVWDPRPPEAWRNARKAWKQFVREVLRDSERYDTEEQVAIACRDGELDATEYRTWKAIEPTFEVNTKVIWHDDSALKVCEKWMKQGPGIVWVDHAFFGRELSRRTGCKYYRRDGKTDAGEFIEDADPSQCIIASMKSNKEGRNLQGRPPSLKEPKGWKGFSRNLITACPSGADDMEQLIGRTDRMGQEADEVVVDILMGCREHAESWLKCLANARATRDTLGQPQKILTADVVGFMSEWEIDTKPGAAWNVKGGGGFVIPSPDSL